MVIKRYQVILTLLMLLPATLAAADNQCLDKTCVDVFTEDNQLIITASKDGAKPKAAPSKKECECCCFHDWEFWSVFGIASAE